MTAQGPPDLTSVAVPPRPPADAGAGCIAACVDASRLEGVSACGRPEGAGVLPVLLHR